MLTLVFLIATDLAILLDIPILRPFLGFLFFTIIPGLLVLHILRLNKLKPAVIVVLSVGVSVAILMFFGLLINQVYFALGYETPLSTVSTVASFSTLVIILGIIAFMTNKGTFPFDLSDFRLDIRDKAFLLLPLLFPLLGILGIYLMNTTDNNIVLLMLLSLIPAYAILLTILHRRIPSKIYAPVIFLFSLSIVMLISLRSNHIIGMDLHSSYYAFQLINNAQHWHLFEISLLNSSLSITLLPTIYQSFMGIGNEYLFKIIFSLIFLPLPLVIYVISKKYLGNLYAFLASLFLMSNITFFGSVGRTGIATLFFALAIMVLFCDDVSKLSKRLLFIIFATSCIVSHYSSAYIFLFLLLATWLGMQILPRLTSRKKKPAAISENPIVGGNPSSPRPDRTLLSKSNTGFTTQARQARGITMITVGLFFVILFFWYSQVTTAPFQYGVRFIQAILLNLNQFFLLEAKGGETASIMGLNLMSRETPWKIEFFLSWLTIILIAIGVLTAMVKYKRMVAIPSSGNEQAPDLLPRKFDIEYFVIALSGCLILVVSVVLPFILRGYSTNRMYFQMMVILSPFFIIGGVAVARWIRTRSYWVILVVLIPYFMCTSGIMYQIFDFPESVVLNSKGDKYNYLYVYDQETAAARWLRNNIEIKRGHTRIYTDFTGDFRLKSQGGLPSYCLNSTSLPDPDVEIDRGYLYLRYHNVVDGKLARSFGEENNYDMVLYQDKFADKAKIYSNGGSEVWQ